MEMDLVNAENILGWAITQTDPILKAKVLGVQVEKEIYKIKFQIGENSSIEFIRCRYIDDSHPTENYLTDELRKALKEVTWKLRKRGKSV